MESSEDEQRQIDLIEMHPFEYLTELNTLNSSCNKANVKSYSSVSRVKLPWKAFNIIKVPEFFERTYSQTRKTTFKQMQKVEGSMDGAQKKIWKEHQDILRKHATRREELKQSFRPKTAFKERKALAEQALGKTKQPHNLFLQRVVEKGGQFVYDKQQLKQEVLSKLKTISASTAINSSIKSNNQHWRAKSAMARSPSAFQKTILPEDRPNTAVKSHISEKQNLTNEKKVVKENDYLEYDKGADIVAKYRENIRQVDCSLSEMNIRKTVGLLKNLQNIADSLK